MAWYTLRHKAKYLQQKSQFLDDFYSNFCAEPRGKEQDGSQERKRS